MSAERPAAGRAGRHAHGGRTAIGPLPASVEPAGAVAPASGFEGALEAHIESALGLATQLGYDHLADELAGALDELAHYRRRGYVRGRPNAG